MFNPLSLIRKLGHATVDRIWRLGFATRFLFAILKYSATSFRRLPLTLRETPQVMQDAMVAVEDRRFRYHPGLDPVGMVRAAAVAVQKRGSGRRLQGASTITQQLPWTW